MNFEGFPFVVGWELTLDCNLRCLHCASTAGMKRAKELTLKEAYNICDQLPTLLVKEVVFTGGEPLLCSYWHKIAARLSNLGIHVAMVSNGLLITDDVITKMKKSNILGVGISIDGTEEIHDQIRGQKGLYNKTIKAVQKLRENNINTTVITSVSGLNINYLDKMLLSLSKLGIWQWQLQPIFPRGRSQNANFLHLTPKDFIKLGLFIRDNQAKAKELNLEIVPADSCGYYSDLDVPNFTWKGCSAGISSCGIMSNGDIKGCLSWPDHITEGNLRNDSFWNIWFNPESFKTLREKTLPEINGACKNCDVALECGGGCQAMSIAAENKWHADPYCYKSILESTPELKEL